MASSSRRSMLVFAGLGLGAVVGAQTVLPRLLAPKLDFVPIEDPPGFRKLTGTGGISGFDPFAGIDSIVAPTDVVAAETEVRADLCGALFGTVPDGAVPIASFSDYNCPFCRVLTQRLAAIEAESDGSVFISWHELPLLGPVSVVAARAALAAKRQDAYVRFHKRLMRAAFQPTPDYVLRLADGLGLDAPQLRADMVSPEINHELAVTGALARVFGLIGTPALVVGSTLVEGEIGEAALDRLIAAEVGRPLPCG